MAAVTVVATVAATRSSQKKKPPAKRRSTAKKPAKTPSRVGGTVGAALDGRSADVAGLALIGIGIIAGAGLYAAQAVPSLADGIQVAAEAIDSGAAARKLEELVAFTNDLAPVAEKEPA